jgi:hypothetical protein
MLNQVTNYTILETDDEVHLTQEVTTHMRDGWVPSGPLIIKGESLLQVMVQFAL